MKIPVPVNGFGLALDAVRYVLHLQRAGLQANFVLATVPDHVYHYEMVLATDGEVLQSVDGAVGSLALEGAQAPLKEAGVPFEREIGSGDPTSTLIKTVERRDCEAIILGARGMGALRSTLLGSVSQAALHASKVLVTADCAH